MQVLGGKVWRRRERWGEREERGGTRCERRGRRILFGCDEEDFGFWRRGMVGGIVEEGGVV